jgi:hypothetical protein
VSVCLERRGAPVLGHVFAAAAGAAVAEHAGGEAVAVELEALALLAVAFLGRAPAHAAHAGCLSIQHLGCAEPSRAQLNSVILYSNTAIQ